MLQSEEQPFDAAFAMIKTFILSNMDSNAVLVCHSVDAASFELSQTQEDDDVMSKLLLILISEEMTNCPSFACDLFKKVESSLKPYGMLVFMPSSKEVSSGGQGLLLVLSLLVALSKETSSKMLIFINKSLPVGHVIRYISQLPE